MRNVKKIVGTSAFFLCLGGLVCSDQLIAADSASGAKEAVLNAAVAEAVTPTAAENHVAIAAADDTATAAAPTVAPEATTRPADSNLEKPVITQSVDGKFEFQVQDLDLKTALHFLSLQAHRNIIVSNEVKGQVTATLYDVSFTEALTSLLEQAGAGFIERGNFIFVYTNTELEAIRKRDRKAVNSIFRLHYLNAQDASVMIKPLMSANGVISLTPAAVSGLPTGLTDTGGTNYGTDDTLVINDFPENIAEVSRVLKELDVRPKQVLVETTILRASLKEDSALGIDFISLSGVDFSTLSNASFTNNSGGSGSSGSGGSGNGTVLTGPNGIFKNFVGDKTQTNVGTDFASKVPSGGLSVGFLSNNIAVFMRALEEVTDTTVVANPKILALNKQKGEVFIGQQFGYKTTTTSQTTTQETVQFLDTGTKLIFRPYIGEDGYVRMEIHPEDSSGGLDANSLPQKASTEVTSNLMVKDGRTVVIGGLFRELTTAGRGQVPVLGNIPILGVPFRRTNDSTERTETIVLLTPHVINDDTAMYDEAQKQAEDMRRMMLGNRAGLQPWGRDRIAQLWFSKANEALDHGDKNKAVMYTDWALNTNPRFLEALKLRETLTNTQIEEASNSSIHTFVKDVLRDDAATTPDFGGSGHYPPPPVVEAPATAPANH